MSDMQRSLKKVSDWLGGFISPQPSLFDILTVGIMGVVFLPSPFLRGSYFVFYSLFLIIFAYLLKPRREYKPISLILFMLWGFISIFIHNEIKVVPNSIINRYFNVSFLSEGFLYILCGAVLLISIVKYSKNLKFAYLLLPVFLYPMYKIYSSLGRLTPVAALVVSIIIFLFLKRKYLLGIMGTSCVIIFVCLKWSYIVFKFQCRPYVWIELLRQIREHPWIGSGFNHTLYPDNMIWANKIGGITYGWVFRHNDLLSIGAYLGVCALLCLAIFIIQTMKRIGVSAWIIPVLTIFLISIFQMTFFEPDKTAICIVLIGISLSETIKREVV